jgi:hypothetical protein
MSRKKSAGSVLPPGYAAQRENPVPKGKGLTGLGCHFDPQAAACDRNTGYGTVSSNGQSNPTNRVMMPRPDVLGYSQT